MDHRIRNIYLRILYYNSTRLPVPGTVFLSQTKPPQGSSGPGVVPAAAAASASPSPTSISLSLFRRPAASSLSLAFSRAMAACLAITWLSSTRSFWLVPRSSATCNESSSRRLCFLTRDLLADSRFDASLLFFLSSLPRLISWWSSAAAAADTELTVVVTTLPLQLYG